MRALNSAGLRFVSAGDEFDAARCPAVSTSVWILGPNGYGYRLNTGEWTPIATRQASSLDDL